MSQTLKDDIARALATPGARSFFSSAIRAQDGEVEDTPDRPADTLSQFIAAVGDHSPFLSRLMSRDAERVPRVLSASADLKELFAHPDPDAPVEAVKAQLRRSRSDVALGIALADLAGAWDLEAVTSRLSAFADHCVGVALQVAWASVSQSPGVQLVDNPPPFGGLALIAMGKLGAQELNYSSDIDLVALYDSGRPAIAPTSRIGEKAAMVKVIQLVVSLLNDQTQDGFVFRTDLRLRPNPGATPVAVALSAAERYYEVYGQNWERAAYIKARACAGDRDTAQAFLETMRSFVWRRTLDYGAVVDIHAVKQQIHAQKGRSDMMVRGGDIKLGPGGIREIEFFAQTQQLLLGGRNRALRSPKTLEALIALEQGEHLDPSTRSMLDAAYTFYRTLEHRLQMLEDEQTQTIPDDEVKLPAVARMLGFDTVEAFEEECLAHLRAVHDAYAELFEVPETDVQGSLVFTGVDDDPRTLDTLTRLGFATPSAVTSRIRGWHQGAITATRSPRARELLTALVPRILKQLGEDDSPDEAFHALDGFLTALPAGFQVFSLFTAEPDILEQVLFLCHASPSLARQMGQRPSLIEGLIEGGQDASPDFPLPEDDDVLETRLDDVRKAVNEHRVRSSAGIILGRSNITAVSGALAAMADQAIAALTTAVRHDLTAHQGGASSGLAVVAFGRLGMSALTPMSDLDLVFIYDPVGTTPDEERWHSRFIKRVVSALSVPTAEGALYEIDMSLRPSGGAGPAAVTVSAFERYYQDKAWVWEEMALTKARVVYAEGGLGAHVDTVIKTSLEKRRDPATVIDAALDMRRRLYTEKPPRSPVDVKRLNGGLMDIDFLAQVMSLIHASSRGRLPRQSVDALSLLCKEGIIADAMAEKLLVAQSLFESLVHYERAVYGVTPPQSWSHAQEMMLRRLSPHWTDAPIVEQVNRAASHVRDAFSMHVGPVVP